MKHIWLRVAETSAARFYTLIVGVFALFFTARILGPDGRGVIAAVTAWVGLFASFFGLSLGQVIQHHVQGRKREEWLKEALGILLPCLLALTLLAYLAALFIYLISSGAVFKNIPISILVLAFAMLPLLIWEDYATNLLAAANELRAYSHAQFIGRSIWVVTLLILLLALDRGVRGALVAQLLGQLVLVILMFQVLWRLAGRQRQFRSAQLKVLLKNSAQLHLNTVGSFLLMQTSVLMLNHYSTKADVGNYQMAYQMVMVLLIIPQAVSMVLFSRMAKFGTDQLWVEQKRLMLQTGLLMSVLAVLSYFTVPSIILVLAGPGFEPSIGIFHLLLPNLIGLTFAQLMTCQWIGRGIFYQTTIVTFLTALANLIACSILIPRYGVLGAIWSGWICYLGVSVLFQASFAWWCEQRYLDYLFTLRTNS